MKTGVVCDKFKTQKFKERLEKEKFNIISQQEKNLITTFVIEIPQKDFIKENTRLSKVLRQLDIELKNSN